MPRIGPKRIAQFIAPFRVKPGTRVRLPRDFDTGGPRERSKAEAKELLEAGVELLAEYQARLAAQDTYAPARRLPAMDAGGKDGTIRHVMAGLDPQGAEVTASRCRRPRRLSHDFLSRFARRCPRTARSASSTGRTTRRC